MISLNSSEEFPALGEGSGGVNLDSSTDKENVVGVFSENPKTGKWRSLFGGKGNNNIDYSSSSCKLPFHKPQAIDGEGVVDASIANTDARDVTRTQSEQPTEKLWTYARNKTTAKKSIPKPATICYLNPFDTLYQEGEQLNQGLMGGSTSIREEEIGIDSIVSKVDVGSVTTSDGETDEDASEKSLDEMGMTVETCDTTNVAKSSVGKMKPMSKEQNFDKLMRFISTLGLARGDKENEVKNINFFPNCGRIPSLKVKQRFGS